MSILEILEDHRFRPSALAVGQCMCDLSKTMRVSVHRAHVAQVLEQHEREAKAVAWEEGFQAGWEEHEDPGAFVNDFWDAKTPNPYADEATP